MGIERFFPSMTKANIPKKTQRDITACLDNAWRETDGHNG